MAVSLNQLNTDYEKSLAAFGMETTGANRGTFAGGSSTVTGTHLGTNVPLMTGLSNMDTSVESIKNDSASQSRATLQTFVSPLQVNNTLGVTGAVNLQNSLTVSGDLIVGGTTTTVNSEQVVIDDPVMTLGGDAPSTIDGMDRGVEYKYWDGSAVKRGFFGLDRDQNAFTFIPDATNTSESFSGMLGNIVVNDGTFNTVTANSFVGPVGGNADTATQLENSLTVNFIGTYATGSTGAFTGNEGSIDVTLTNIQADRWTNPITITYVDDEANLGDVVGTVGFNGSQNKPDIKLNVKRAEKWKTARTITLGGDTTGAVTLDGTADVNLAVTVTELPNKANISGDNTQDFATKTLSVGAGGWAMEQDVDGNVVIKHGTSTLFKITTAGNVLAAGDISAQEIL